MRADDGNQGVTRRQALRRMGRAALASILGERLASGGLAAGRRLRKGQRMMRDTTRHLFLDDHEIERIQNLRRVVNQPSKREANPVVRADRSWENSVSVYGTTFYDDAVGCFRMYYLVGCPMPGEWTDDKGERHPYPATTKVGYAISTDGVHWEKPELGQVDLGGSKANNLLAIGRQNAEGISVLRDDRDPDAGRRYKALYWDHAAGKPHVHPTLGRVLWEDGSPTDGAYVAWSADGIRWTIYQGNPVIQSYMDTNQNLLWDPEIKRYVAFSRFGFGRKIARSESADFMNWSKPALVMECDAADGEGTQFYGMGCDLYEGLYMGMLWVYREGGDGCIDTQLGVSRDGIKWERVADRRTFLPLGPKGSWDDGMARCAERIIRVGDELYIYYSGVNGPHSGPKFPADKIVRTHKPGIGLAILRRDGFVSLDAGEEEGTLLTKPFEMPQGRLHLNVDASSGWVRAGICDEAGKPLPGLERSERVTGDQKAALVVWPGEARVPAGKTTRLLLTAKRAKLYSYWFE